MSRCTGEPLGPTTFCMLPASGLSIAGSLALALYLGPMPRVECSTMSPIDVVGEKIERRLDDCGRDAHYWAPPAQNRTCGIPASGSHLGCLTAKCPYTVQSRGHACPARSPARAGLSRILLGPLPSLHQLRLRSPDAVRRLRSYYGEV